MGSHFLWTSFYSKQFMGINFKKILATLSEVGFLTIICLSPIMQMEKLRHRQIK